MGTVTVSQQCHLQRNWDHHFTISPALNSSRSRSKCKPTFVIYQSNLSYLQWLIKTPVRKCRATYNRVAVVSAPHAQYNYSPFIRPNTSLLLCHCMPVRSCCSYFNSFYLTGKDSFCRRVFNLIVQRCAMEVADLINNVVSTVPTNGSSTSGTKEQKGKHCSVKDVHLNERLSYEAGNLFFWDLSVQTCEALRAFLHIPCILWTGYPEPHCALFHCFVLFLWFVKCFSLVSLAYKMHSIVFTK